MNFEEFIISIKEIKSQIQSLYEERDTILSRIPLTKEDREDIFHINRNLRGLKARKEKLKQEYNGTAN